MEIKHKEKLYDLRRSRRLTQKELAIRTGLTEKTIANYEDGITNLRNAKYRNVEKIANALNVTIDDIILSFDSEKPKQPTH